MSQRQVFVSIGLGVLRLVFSLLGAAVPGLLGIPGSSGVINILWAGGFLALPPLITRALGSATVAAVIYSLLALPLPLSGPPGFLPKVLIGILSGLTADLVMMLVRIAPNFERSLSTLAGAASQTVLGISLVLLGIAFQVPGIDQAAKLQFSLPGMAATILGGAFSGFLGWLVYHALKESDL